MTRLLSLFGSLKNLGLDEKLNLLEEFVKEIDGAAAAIGSVRELSDLVRSEALTHHWREG